MSGGTPAGQYMRQRHSQGYASGGDDLEDDACSRPQLLYPPVTQRIRSWVETMENVLWIASAIFIIYFGDRHSNFIHLLWRDGRIRRMPLYLGMLGVGANIIIFLYTSMYTWSLRRFDEKWEISSVSALPLVTLLGVISFFLLSLALWPIWSFLTLPLLVHLIDNWSFMVHCSILVEPATSFLNFAVHIVYGVYGCLSKYFDWDVQATEQCISHRLSFSRSKQGDIYSRQHFPKVMAITDNIGLN